GSSKGGAATGAMNIWGYILIGLVVAIAVGIAWRVFRRRDRTAVAETTVAAGVPDLTREDVSAADRPEEEWVALARDFALRGDFRMAVRALYLATLACLARRQLIALHKGKSN